MSSLPLDMLRSRSGFAEHPRFSGAFAAAVPPEPAPPAPDPIKDAFEQGYVEGFTAAREEAGQLALQQETARQRIELAFGRLNEEGAVALSERLRQTVLAICEEAVMPLAIDPAGLSARIEKAVAMLQRAQDERRVLLHPDDLALVHARLPAGLTVQADPSVERGGLRIETADGGIEDGPAQWRRILSEALRAC